METGNVSNNCHVTRYFFAPILTAATHTHTQACSLLPQTQTTVYIHSHSFIHTQALCSSASLTSAKAPADTSLLHDV